MREFNELLAATEPGVLTTKLHHCHCVVPASSKTGVVLEKKCVSYSLTGARKKPAQYVSNPLLSFARASPWALHLKGKLPSLVTQTHHVPCIPPTAPQKSSSCSAHQLLLGMELLRMSAF